MGNELIILGKWAQAKQAIAACVNLDELKVIRDKAQALMSYAKMVKESLEVQNNVAEIKIRCERKMGEFSKQLPQNKLKGLKNRTSSQDGATKKDILKQAGIKHHERYESIASLPEELFESHITKVKGDNEELTTAGVLKIARNNEREGRNSDLPKVEMPEGQFDVILADPPWKYEYSLSDSRKIENQYPTMELQEIMDMKVPSSDNSVLLLWATAPKLEEAMKALSAWGFSYKTCAVWDKQDIGMGYWFRNQHELLLIGTKGTFPPPESQVRVSSVYSEKRGLHSKKPDYYYKLIESMFPNGKYLELFARKKYSDKWQVYGNDVQE